MLRNRPHADPEVCAMTEATLGWLIYGLCVVACMAVMLGSWWRHRNDG